MMISVVYSCGARAPRGIAAFANRNARLVELPETAPNFCIASQESASNVTVVATVKAFDVNAPNAKPAASLIARDDESALVSDAKAGDVSAFTELVTRYERKIYRLTLNITQNREDAEDAMQDAFLKSYQHLDGFEGGSRF